MNMKRLTFLAALVSTTALISVGQAHAQTHATAPAQSSASPQGAQLAAGAASVTQNGTETTITQTSQQAILNWQSFSIDKGNTVNVLQPGATSVLLNRVTGNATSMIAGQLNANGQVCQIIDSYATGAVVPAPSTPLYTVGGLVGFGSAGGVSNSYWNTQTSGQAASSGGTGLTTAQLDGPLPTGFDSAVWTVATGRGPELKAVTGQ